MNTQINLRVPQKLLRDMQREAKERGFGTLQAFILETLREEIYDELTPRERKLLTKMFEKQDHEENGNEAQLSAALRLRSEGFRICERHKKEQPPQLTRDVHARARATIPRTT